MGRCVWVRDGDVEGLLQPGATVTASKGLDDWCLRGDDGGEPISAGAELEVLERREWGACMVEEVTEDGALCVSDPAEVLSYLQSGELPALSEAEDAESRDADARAWLQAARELESEGLWEFVDLPVGSAAVAESGCGTCGQPWADPECAECGS